MLLKGKQGFSLIELLVSMAILGILASIAAPTIGNTWKEWKVDRFSRTLLTANRTARFKAITYQTEIQARYDMDENLLEFLQNTNRGYESEDDNWIQFNEIATLRADDQVDIYSVADLETGEACMVYKKNGTATTHYDPEGNINCTGGSELGSGVHVTWADVDDSTIDENTTCRWNTIHIIQANAKPMHLPYGAYPNEAGPFQKWDSGENVPACAE